MLLRVGRAALWALLGDAGAAVLAYGLIVLVVMLMRG